MELDFKEIGRRTGRSVEEVARSIEQAKISMMPLGKQVSIVEGDQTRWLIVTRRDSAYSSVDPRHQMSAICFPF